MIKRNAAKPVRVVPPMMEEQETSTSTLQELLEKEETVSNLIFCKGKEEGISKSYKSFKNCTFRNQTFSECKFRSSQLTDVRFENCDLSNISFAESSLYRVEFISCKLLGTNLSETTMNHVLLHDCNAAYINLAMSKMNQVRFSHCHLRNGSFNDCRFSSVAFESLRSGRSRFFSRSASGIDLRTSRIGGITLNISDLKGAVITFCRLWICFHCWELLSRIRISQISSIHIQTKSIVTLLFYKTGLMTSREYDSKEYLFIVISHSPSSPYFCKKYYSKQ